jgi:hypothetical protein
MQSRGQKIKHYGKPILGWIIMAVVCLAFWITDNWQGTVATWFFTILLVWQSYVVCALFLGFHPLGRFDD